MADEMTRIEVKDTSAIAVYITHNHKAAILLFYDMIS
jgi:hypothetical protein